MRAARLIGLLAALTACDDSNPEVNYHVHAIGDSIAVGMGRQLQYEFSRSLVGMFYSAKSINGYTLAQGENFWRPHLLSMGEKGLAPNVLIVSLGTNDALQSWSLDYLDYHIGQIVDSAPSGARILWLPISELQYAVPEQRRMLVNERIACNRRVHVVDLGPALDCLSQLFPQVADAPYPDGVHPREELYACIAAVLVQQVEAAAAPWFLGDDFKTALASR